MITHVFNSSIVSGPEMLVLPALTKLEEPVTIVFLAETRLEEASQKPIEYARRLGHKVYSVPVRGRWDREAFLELRRVLDDIKPDVVHAHDVKASLYLYQAKKIQNGFKPSIVSTHHGAAFRKGKIRLYEEFYVRMILPHFDSVVCVCQQDKASVIRRGVPEEKVSIHLNGTDRLKVTIEERAQASYKIRKSWKIKMPTLPGPDQAYFLGVVARLSPEKRHDRMIRAIAALNEKDDLLKPVVLVCFGLGAEEAKLRALAIELGVDSLVYFMGYSDTISQEMAGFDMLLSLSDGEGIPINLLEAGWAATPVVATRVGGIPDLIPGYPFGYLVEKKSTDDSIAQGIALALKNPEQRCFVGHEFQKRVMEQFSQEAWLRELKRIYGSLRLARALVPEYAEAT